MRRHSTLIRILLIGGLTIAALCLSAFLGPRAVEWAEVIGRKPGEIFWQLRVPRVLLAAVAGAGLALTGLLTQILFRNPLATPDTLGISAAAALAAAWGILAQRGAISVGGGPSIAVLAVLGALAATGVILLLARQRGGRDVTRLLLAGVCIAAFCSAGIILATYLGQAAITNEIVQWMMGSLGALSPTAAGWLLCVVAPAVLLVLTMHRALDQLHLGDLVAASRGVSVAGVLVLSLAVIGLVTAAIVAHCGPISFVGLIVPHIARGIVGHRSGPLVVATPMIGAAFLAGCDGLSRAMSSYEVPVGVLTSLVGAVFFFYLITRPGISSDSQG